MKKYITWNRKKVNDNYYQDPNTNDRASLESGWVVTFTETPYQLNWTFISVVEYPDNTPQEQLDYFMSIDPDFNFTILTEEEANALLQTAYNWEVSVNNFVFTDNRPNNFLI